MLNCGNGVFIDDLEASNDISKLLKAHNMIEQATQDVNQILVELEPLSGNTKDVLYEDAVALKKNLEAMMEEIQTDITKIKTTVEHYKEVDAKIKREIEASAAANSEHIGGSLLGVGQGLKGSVAGSAAKGVEAGVKSALKSALGGKK